MSPFPTGATLQHNLYSEYHDHNNQPLSIALRCEIDVDCKGEEEKVRGFAQ